MRRYIAVKAVYSIVSSGKRRGGPPPLGVAEDYRCTTRRSHATQAGCVCNSLSEITVSCSDAVFAGTVLGLDGLATGQYRNPVGNGIRPSRVAGQGREGHDDQRWHWRPTHLHHG